MGQKTQPIGFRLGINRTWDSRWFGGKLYADLLHQDIGLRKYLFDKLKSAAISKIVIERPAGRARISIYAGRPGLVIGKKGQDIETLRTHLAKQTGSEVSLNIIEIRKPELDAKLVADGIAQQLEKRGHKINIDLYSGGFGRGQIIIKEKNGYKAGTETRCDGFIAYY